MRFLVIDKENLCINGHKNTIQLWLNHLKQNCILICFKCWTHFDLSVQDNWLDFYTLRPRQNGRHFTDNIFKCIFLIEKVWILLKISLKFVPKIQINNIPAMVQIMAWCRPGDKPLSGPMMVIYWRIYASVSLNELKNNFALVVSTGTTYVGLYSQICHMIGADLLYWSPWVHVCQCLY